jgi:ABC-type transport system involved in multi-copper enzyme maturation permease subunit
MRPSSLTQFRTLAVEALLDAVRRRIVVAIAVVSLLSLMLVDTCTTCSGGEVVVNGQVKDMVNIAGWTGTVTFAVLGLWSIVLAGVLASEHLAQTLSDGSATLALARPVGRGTFAFARLAGSLAIAFATGAVLLGGTALFLNARSGLPTGPALAAGLSCALGMVTVAALAMTASLYIPRIATVMLVFVATGATTLANVLAMFSDATSGVMGAIDRFGPPLCSSIAVALSPWITEVGVPGSPTEIATRHALWAAASVALLWALFRRIELRD